MCITNNIGTTEIQEIYNKMSEKLLQKMPEMIPQNL